MLDFLINSISQIKFSLFLVFLGKKLKSASKKLCIDGFQKFKEVRVHGDQSEKFALSIREHWAKLLI